MKINNKKDKVDKKILLKKNKVVRDWVNQHINDHYVHLANRDGYRSRAAYKLLEIDKDSNLFVNVKCVVDLGSAPGSWSQIAAQKVGKTGCVLAVDLLKMDPIEGVTFTQGDFSEDAVLQQILAILKNQTIDLIISDMAPNLSGIKVVDQSRSSYLIELVLEFAREHLKLGGKCLIKLFIGGEFERVVKMARELFAKVEICKPDASRSKSSETYLLCVDKLN